MKPCPECGGLVPIPNQNYGINPQALCHCCQCQRCVGAKRLKYFVRDDAMTTKALLRTLTPSEPRDGYDLTVRAVGSWKRLKKIIGWQRP